MNIRKKFFEWIRSVSGLSTVEHLYAILEEDNNINPFLQAAKIMDFRITTNDENRNAVPSQGPVIVVANHPTGGRDSVNLMNYLLQYRADIKVVSHFWFRRFSAFGKYTIFMDPAATSGEGKKMNSGAIRECVQWLHKGGMLVLFPGGGVSYPRRFRRTIHDPQWTLMLDLFINQSEAVVLPVSLNGTNSIVYNTVSRIAPAIRAILLARELLLKRGSLQHLYFHPCMDKNLMIKNKNGRSISANLQQLVESRLYLSLP